MTVRSGCIGILTAGGDCPGLNAAIRAVTLAANRRGMDVIGFYDGFSGLINNQTVELCDDNVGEILSVGGTMLGTSRLKLRKVRIGSEKVNLEDIALQNIMANRIDTLVCLGGGGTQKNACKLMKRGLNVVTLPKTIDNDVWGTELCFGYDSAVQIATNALEQLGSTARSHHRIMVCELMGHKAGWLALSAGVAAGADVILIPEIPFELEKIARHIAARKKAGFNHSIIAVAEGAVSREIALEKASKEKADKSDSDADKKGKAEDVYDSLLQATRVSDLRDDPVKEKQLDNPPIVYHMVQEPLACQIARKLQEMTGSEARATVLGHVQRGGCPSAADRQLATMLGVFAADSIEQGNVNIMAAWINNSPSAVALDQVAGKRKVVPPESALLQAARMTGCCLGD
ncbi:MAG: ATP-dependent 6-phosphofructokinase [Sedimentisphaerales bacterium]|nr:ATP-dependent 6-phosphofructokinase [Sedimentisphaerales bacterium]MBN2843949.1 ATP-dependent 6-phosphofructokinase [Sedimentisphaerales bacterium]